MQTDDMLRTLHQRPDTHAPNDIDRLMAELSRIAEALEQRNRIDEKMADFAAMLQQGAGWAGDTDVAPDGLPRQRR